MKRIPQPPTTMATTKLADRLAHALSTCRALAWGLAVPLIGFLSQGCEQVIEVDLPPHIPQLVISCLFSPDSTMLALATASKPLQALGEPGPVLNANIVVDENGTPWDTLRFLPGVELPYYQSQRKPVAGRTYRVRASAPGYSDVQGEDRIPLPVPIASITRRDNVVGFELNADYSELTISFDDPVGLGDTYVMSIYQLDSVEIAPGQYIFFPSNLPGESSDPLVEVDYELKEYLLVDNAFDGSRPAIKVRAYTSNLDKPNVFVALAKVSDHFFRYKRSFVSAVNNAFNPFAEPDIVHSNMTPKMGIFAGYSVTRAAVPQ
jgi:Domain of unknown function (DUF4249)